MWCINNDISVAVFVGTPPWDYFIDCGIGAANARKRQLKRNLESEYKRLTAGETMCCERDMGAGTGSSKKTTNSDGCIGYCLEPDDTKHQASPYDQHQQLHLERPGIHCQIVH